MDYAPVITREYLKKYPLESIEGKILDKNCSIDAFKGKHNYNFIFDGAAIGQYIAGIPSKSNSQLKEKYINENCLYNASFFDIKWEYDSFGAAPYIYDGESKYKIMNLHIHSKQLNKYRSDNMFIR